MKYPKIETLYKRDTATFKVTDELRLPEFGLINSWLVTEKIDGTNCRVIYTRKEDVNMVEIRGRTDKAQWNPVVLEQLQAMFTLDQFRDAFPDLDDDISIIVYGEAYGPKIQSGGKYRDDVCFRAFDVRVGDWWLNWSDVEDVAQKMKINTVPCLGIIYELPFDQSDLYRIIPDSVVARHEKDDKVLAEGIVARTEPLLFNRRGHRVLWKLKFKDFQ